MRRWVLFLIALMPLGICQGQTGSWTMSNGDTIHINACQFDGGTIYDNGGPSGNYSNNFNGWVVITATTNISITLTGDYITESPSYDWIDVWDGNTNGTQLVNHAGGTGSINSVVATSGQMTIYFHSDGSNVYSGFALHWSHSGGSEYCTANITSLETSDITPTSAVLNWTSDATTLQLDYGNGVLTVDGDSPEGGYTLTGLNPNTVYSVRIYAEGDGASPCCITYTSFRTGCDTMVVPLVEDFDDYGYGDDVFPTCWWLIKNIDGSQPANITHDNYSTYPASLRLSTTTAGYYVIAIMPDVSGTPINQLMMRLRVRAPYSNTKLEVGICNDTGSFDVLPNYHNFTAVDTITISTANQWQEYIVSFSGYTGTGLRPALRMHGDLQPSSGLSVYVDEVRVETCGVWHQALLKRNANELWVQWDEYGDPQVDVEYGPAGFENGNGITLADTASPLSVTGLDPGTNYEFRFHTGCGGGAVTADYSSLTLSTLEGPRNDLNLCENFESTGNIPSGWRHHNVNDNTPQTSNNYHHSGGRSLRMRPYYSSTMPLVVLPMIDTVPIGQLSVSFWAYSPNHSSGCLEVGVMEYPEVAASFMPVDTIYVNSHWQRNLVSLESYAGNGKYIALRAFDPNTTSNSMYIDDLEVGTCLLNSIYLTNIGSHTVELRWDTVDANYHGDSVIVEYGGSGFLAGEGTRVAVAVRGDEVTTVGGKQTLTIGGLEADSVYEFRVYGQCGVQVQACAVTTLTAQTLEQNLSLPYCVDFEGMTNGSYPSGWSRPSMYDNFPRIYDNGYDKHSGNRAIYLRSYRTLENHSTIVLPMFDVDSVNGLTLNFFTWGESSDGQTVQIGIMDDPNDESTFTEVNTVSAPYNKWSNRVITIDGYTGTGKYIALRYWNNYYWSSNGLWIDDLIVSDAAAADRTVSSVTSHGASFTWNGTGRAYNGAYVEWDTAGFVRGTGHKDTVDANTFSLTIDTLQMGTTYDYFITALSSEAEASCNYTRQSFTTFEQPTASSYCYGFEDLAPESYPWNYTWYRPLMYGAEPRAVSETHSGTYAMYLRSYYNNHNPEYRSMAVMPPLEEDDLDGLTLRFYAKGSGWNSRFAIGFMSDPNDTSTFEGIDTFTVDHGDWRLYAVDLSQYSGTARHLAFLHYSNPTWESGWVYFDDITIDRCRVSRVRAYSETQTTVKIDWDSTGQFDSVQVEYGLQGFAPGAGTILSTTDTVVILTGLESGSAYDYYVRPYCTGSSRACSEQKYQFSTTMTRVGDGWCEDFESHNGSGSMPRGWHRAVGQDGWPYIWTHSDSRYYTSSNSAFEFRTYGTGLNIAVMPCSEDPLQELIVSFNMRLHTDQDHPERCRLVVGVMPNPFDTAAFVPVDTLSPTYAYQRRDVSLASCSGPYRHIAFKYLDSDYRITYIDDLVLSRCRPTNVWATAVADSSISISWIPMGYTDTTFIMWRVENGEWDMDTVVGSTATFSNLMPDTNYSFYLFGGCVDTLIECQGAYIQQRTLAEPMRAPMCFLFDGATTADGLPTGWIRPYGNTESCQSNGQLQLYAYSCNDNNSDRTNMLVMPQIAASTLDGLWLDMDTRFDNNQLRLEVGVMTNPYDSATFTPIDTLSGSNQWRRKTVDLSRYTDTGRFIAFRSHAQYCSSGYLYLRRLSLRSCILTSAAAGHPTDTSLTITYTASEGTTGAWVEYKHIGGPTDDFTPGSGDTLRLTSPSPFTINGLEYATWYAFHFYPDCGEGSDDCNYVLSRAQTLHPGVDIPYCENFDNYVSGNFMDNWRRHTSYSDERPVLYSGVSHSPDNSMLFEAYGDNYAMAVMPRLNVGHTCPLVDSLYANFWIYSDYNWDRAALVVGIITDANDPTTFQSIDTLRPTAYATWEHHTVAIRNFSSTNTYIAYKFFSTDDYGASLRMDDLCMEKCVAADVTVGEITQNSVTISWTSFGVDSLVCEYGPRGYAAGSGTMVVLHNSPATITGLDDGTDYQFSFASVCGCQQYGATYAPGGGSSGGWSGGYGGGCGWRYCGWCWGWTWHRAQNNSDSSYWYWCWGPWQGHPWSWTPSSSGGEVYLPPYVDTVTTQASFLAIPYCEGFEEYERITAEADDLIEWPRSWRRIHGQNPGYPKLTKTNHHTGENSLVFYSIAGSSNYAALAPLEPGVVSNLVLSFYAYATSQNAIDYPGFVVGVMTDPDNAATFTPIDTVRLTATGVWEQHVVDLASYIGSGQYVAFHFKPFNGQYHFYVDDLYLGTCAISHLHTQSGYRSILFPGNNEGVNDDPLEDPFVVKLSWQNHHSPSHLQVLYGPQGFNPSEGTAIDTLYLPGNVTQADLTSLGIDPTDSYDLYVTAVCDDTATAGCLSAPITLNPCLKAPYCENFEDLPAADWPQSTFPSIWKIVQRNASRPQYPRTESQYNRHIMAFFPGTGSNSNTVLLPPLPVGDSLNGKWVYAHFASSDNNHIYLDFGYLADTNNPSSFVQMASISNGASDQLREFNAQLLMSAAPAEGDAYNRFVLRARSTSGERWIRLSALTFANHPYPTGISDTALGIAQRRITWSGRYNNAYYSIEYGHGDRWNTVTSDSCSALLTGLQPGTRYEVYFISPDGERLCLPYSFTTPEYISLPYCDDFESYNTYSLPEDWTRTTSWSTNYDYPRVENNVWWVSGHKSMQFHNGCSSNRWDELILSDIDIDSIKQLSLRFQMRFDYADNNMMIVGVQTTQSDKNTFVPVDTLYGGYSWQLYNISLAQYQGDGRYITFRYKQTGSGCHYAYIDDLEISACPLPNFTVAGAHQVKVTLPSTSLEFLSVIDYYIEYDTAGFEKGTGNIVHVTENPYYITTLGPNTRYDFYANCNDPSMEPVCATPTTLITAQELTLPLCDNFDSYDNEFVPTGWYSYSSYGDNYPRTYYYSYQSCCRTMDFYCDKNHLQYTTLPDIDIDSVRHLDLYFNLRIEQINHTKLVVGVMEDRADFNTFMAVDTLTGTSNGNYSSKHVSMAKYQGNGRFVTFRILNDDGSRRPLYVDDLRVNGYPTPQITLYNANTVRILREDNRDFWIEMAPQDTAQGDDTNHWYHITQDTFDITGLDFLTTYDFYHHADSSTLTCFPRTQITTSTVLTMPYCDDFSDYSSGSMPTGWKKVSYSNTSYPQRNYNGHIQFYNDCNSNSRSYAIMPELDIDSLRHAELYFNLYSERTQFLMIIGVMTDQNNTATFTAVDTVQGSSTWQAVHVSMSRFHGNGRFLAFCFVNTNGYCSSMYIDDLTILSCPRPSIQLVGGTTAASIVDTNYSPDYWLEYGPQGMTPGEIDTIYNADISAYTLQPHNTLLHVTSDTTFITDLAENTTYDFYARCDSVYVSCYPRTARITTSRIQTVPYCEEFSSYGSGSSAFPTGWRRYMSDNSNDRLYIYNDSDAGDGKSLRFQIYNGLYAYAVLPEMDVEDINNLYVRAILWSQGNTDAYDKFLIVGVMTDMNDVSTFQAVDTLQNTASGCWQELTASLASYTGNGRFIAIRMRTTNSNWRNLYIDRLEILSCDIPANAQTILHSHNQVRIEATDQSRTGFWVEYGLMGFEQGTGQFVFIDELPMVLTLDNSTSYDFYYRCDTLTATCHPAQTVTTLPPPVNVPYCESFDNYTTGSLPTYWQRLNMNSDATIAISSDEHHSGSKSLKMSSYNNRTIYAVLPDLQVDRLQDITLSMWVKGSNNAIVTVGVMSDPNDPGSFLAVKQINCPTDWTRYLVSLSLAPDDGRFVALRYTSSYYYYPNAYIDDLHISTCGATEMHLTNVEANQVTFDWLQTGEPEISIEYGPTGFTRGTGNVISAIGQQHPTTGHYTYTLTELDNLTNYKFYFDATCDNNNNYCTTNYSDSATVFTPSGGTGCIDPTNLTADYTTCFYGTYNNPLAATGVMDYGAANIESRHTVHYDTTEHDPRTGGQLRTVPTGAEASVRLGNWGSGAEAEAITYSLAVDTTQFDLLILKYAALLQAANHPDAAQPKFQMELLDSNGVLLDTCSQANFIAKTSLGWNFVPSTSLLWKDWTTVGVDMTPYHGQTVRVRLTVYDCADGSHYGYAYFTLNCQMKNLISDRCGVVAENRFTAPDGFNYKWYTNHNDSTYSTQREITVATSDTVTYYCQLSFVDNPACHFTMSAFAGTRWPLSLFDSSVVIRDCRFEVTFANHSTISTDGVNPVGTGESVETATWDFGNGATSAIFNPTVTYDSAGTYIVQLVSTIAGGECSHALEKEITLAFPPTNPHISGTTERCLRAPADTLWLHEASQWTQWRDTVVTVSPESDTTYTLIATDSNGCQHTLSHTLNVHPVYHDTLYGTICSGNPYTFEDTTLTTAGTYHFPHSTFHYGCDSIRTLILTVNENTVGDTVATVCDSLSWYGNIYTSSTESPTHLLTNAAGCDSTVTLHLTVNHSTKGDTTANECNQFSWHGTTYTANGDTATRTMVNAAGCDSTVTLRLTLRHSTAGIETATSCDSYHWHGTEYTESTSAPTHTSINAVGCDSITTLHLTVNHSSSGDTAARACDSLYWQGTVYTVSEDIPWRSLSNTMGCDSSVTMHLTIAYSNSGDTTAIACDLFAWRGRVYTASVDTATRTLINTEGCDSTVTLHLTVNATTAGDTIADECDQFTWYGTTYTSSTEGSTHLSTNAAGCDSTTSLHLTVRHSSSSTVQESVLENDLPHNFNGVDFYNDTVDATVTITNAAGCDSVISYSLTVYWNGVTNADSTICDSELPLTWNGVTFAAAGIQNATLTDAFGADSVVRMTLHVNPTYHLILNDTICDNQNFSFEDTTLTTSGTFNRLLATANFGCDSLRTLNLTVNATTAGDTIADECNQFTWYGATYTSSTEGPTHLSTNAAGCDSTTSLHLTVRHSSSSTVQESALENDLPHNFNGMDFYNDTVDATVTITNTAGCDSIISYSLTVYWNGVTNADSTICDSELPLTWNGVAFAAAGIQNATLTDAFGADSVVRMTLHVNPTYHLILNDTICDNQNLSFEDTTLTTAGSYNRLLATANFGCDSLHTLNLTVNATTMGDTTADVCDSLLWHGNTYFLSTEEPTYLTTNLAGCDSTVTLHLTVRHSTANSVADAVVENNLPHAFNGMVFDNDTTDALVTITNIAGCDSVISYSLTVYRNVDTTLYDTLCESALPIAWNGITFDTTLTVAATMRREVTYPNHFGADSVVTMLLTVLPLYDYHFFDTICDNQILGFEDTTLATSGTFLFPLTTFHHGCDSLRTLHLTVHPTYDHQLYDTTCSNHPVVFGGESRNLSGIYTDSLLTLRGCDSVATLHLKVWPAYDLLFYDTICDNQSLGFEDTTLATPGAFPFPLTTLLHGCDSLRTLQLAVFPTYDLHFYDTIYDGDHYIFEQSTYDTTGTYTHLLQGVAGCDSLRTLHLQRNPRTRLDSTMCSNHLPVVWNGLTFTQAGADSVHLVTSTGADSLVVMTLAVHDTAATLLALHACDSLRWQDGTLYTASTVGPTLTLATTEGCDSVLHLNLTVDYARASTDSLEICDSVRWIDGRWYSHDTSGITHTLATVAGCDSVVTLVLSTGLTFHTYLSDTMCYNETFRWQNQAVHSAEYSLCERFELSDTLRTAEGCDSVLHLTLLKLAQPSFRFDTTALCHRRQYRLEAIVTAPFEPGGEPQPLTHLLWTSYPIDTLLDDHEQEPVVNVEPAEKGTQYLLLADYDPSPRCPATDTITLYPLRIPEAALQVTPQVLDFPNLTFTAHDISHLPGAKRTWYIDGVRQIGDGPSLTATAPDDADSVNVALELFNGQCRDTALALVPIHRILLTAPNIFTPTEGGANSRFFIATEGVISGELYIYNREGLLVYHAGDYTEGWDGRSRSGTMCPQGNYVWKLVYRAVDRPEGKHVEVGSVLLVK